MPIEGEITVFGGTGFLGRRIVQCLLRRDLRVRVASRNPQAVLSAGAEREGVSLVRADLRDAASVAEAVAGSAAVVNAVGHYVEKRGATFHAIHVEGARTVAAECREHGVARLLHISGIGADAEARSPYVRSRGLGEAAVRAVFDRATIFRPSVMFAKDDAFLNTLLSLVRRAPAIPLFARGETKLQPVFAGDVAEAAAQALSVETPAALYALGGSQIYSYAQLLSMVMNFTGRRPRLVPLPFPVWDALAAAASVLPRPPITEGQVALMKHDNVVPPDLPGLKELGISPTPIERVLGEDFDPAGPGS